MQSTQKGPKVKLPWISFQLPPAYMALANKECVATKGMLESMGFEIPSTPGIARDKRGNLKKLLHVKLSDDSELTTQIKWQKWSRYTRCPLCARAREKCFHSVDKFCSCQDRDTEREGKSFSSSAKAVDNMVSEEPNAIQALYAKMQVSSSEDALVNTQGAEWSHVNAGAAL
eukprot:2187746-Pleurochrysis_carterae.AAC.1